METIQSSILFRHIPLSVYGLSLAFFVLLTVFLNKKKGQGLTDSIMQSALVEYLFLVFCSTVFFRPEKPEMEYVFTPFWKYSIAFSFKDMFGIWEILMNVILFIPIGFLSPVLLKSLHFLKKEFLKILLFCMSISISIELLQLLLRRGMCETDDLTHNTLGGLIGYGLYRLFCTRILKKRKEV